MGSRGKTMRARTRPRSSARRRVCAAQSSAHGRPEQSKELFASYELRVASGELRERKQETKSTDLMTRHSLLVTRNSRITADQGDFTDGTNARSVEAGDDATDPCGEGRPVTPGRLARGCCPGSRGAVRRGRRSANCAA